MSAQRKKNEILNDLLNHASGLSEGRLALLVEMADALGRSVRATVNPRSDLVNGEFESDFSGRLLLFHAMHDAALTKKTFEYFFVGANRSAGREASQTVNDVHPGEDVVVDGTRYSLKTEGGKSIRGDSLHISKLMEARWIRECRGGDDFNREVRDKVIGHLAHYQRIVSLRSFTTRSAYKYELVEIPKSLLLRAGYLSPRSFSARTKNGSSSADVVDDRGRRLFVLSLDGSVEKVTVRSLAKSACIVHAEWTVSV